MIYRNLKLNKEIIKNYQKNNLSLIDKKITTVDSDIQQLYKKYSIAKKERQNQEKNQKTIINRIKYLEDEEKKLRLKCESLSKKIAMKSKTINGNNNNIINKSFCKYPRRRNDSKLENEIKYNNTSFNNNKNDKEKGQKNYVNYKKPNRIMLKELKINPDNGIHDNLSNGKHYLFNKKSITNDYLNKKGKERKTSSVKNYRRLIECETPKLNTSFRLTKPNFYKNVTNNENDRFNISHQNKLIYSNNSQKHYFIPNNKYSYRNYKINSIRHLITNMNNRKQYKKSNSTMDNRKNKSFYNYKRNNSLINNYKNDQNIVTIRPSKSNSKLYKFKNISYIESKNLTTSNIIGNEDKIKKERLNKSIEVKRKKVPLSNDKLDKNEKNEDNKENLNIKKNKTKIIIIKKKNTEKDRTKTFVPFHNNKDKNIIDAIDNYNITYDFIINDDKIYYNDNTNLDEDEKKNGNKNSDLYLYNKVNPNYILIKNEEKLKNIINKHKNKKIY